MEQGVKRKAETQHTDDRDKKAKHKKQWRVPKKGGGPQQPTRVIAPGDSGIWVTCDKGREGKCTGEVRDLFNEYAAELYHNDTENDSAAGDNDEPLDIESEIKAEVSEIRKPGAQQLFTPVRVDVQCVLFFKTLPPVQPTAFVQHICEDALRNPQRKRTRFVKRLSPMTLIGRASPEGLEKIAKEVLAPHFHQTPAQSRTFAIRPSIRNHHIMTRDSVIKQVASLVGPGHKVDLQGYELLILVEIYQSICGISVVSNDFERLKRYNLAEIFEPTPKDHGTAKQGSNKPPPAESISEQAETTES